MTFDLIQQSSPEIIYFGEILKSTISFSLELNQESKIP